MKSADPTTRRVLIFAPIGRDGAAAAGVLRRAGHEAAICTDLSCLLDEIEAGAACVLIAEEGLFGRDTGGLSTWVEHQPPWSDLPFVVLTSHQEQPAVTAWREKLVAALRNVSLLERPVQAITLASAVQAALRARSRQYEVRALLDASERAAQELESQVVARTSELEAANVELRNQMAERARIEETLRQSQKIEAIGQLTGGVAHDFNNLLMVISGGLEMLDRQVDSTRRRKLLDGMQQAAQRGAALTRQLLAFSRRQPLKPEAVDIARQIGGMRELLDRSLRGNVHVTFDLPLDLWPIDVDPGELELVVLNLAVNSRDAMPRGGTIRVWGENLPGFRDGNLVGDFVRLTVSDNGTGMTPDIKQRVFEPFFTTKDIGHGSGLGLAQVYGFATQSGGTVRIDSQVDEGTEVNLFLPRSLKAPRTHDHHFANLRVERQQPGQAGRVLLVEDEDEVAALVSQMLNELGFEVTRAATAEAALGALANGRSVDVVFSDIMMPGGMDGVDLAREVHKRRPGLPMLLTSGYAEAAKLSAEAEGVRVLPKPYRLEELAAALQMVTAQAQASVA